MCNSASRLYDRCMPAPLSRTDRGTPATRRRTVEFCDEVFDAKAKELGADSEQAKAELGGVDRATLHRYRTGKTVPPLDKAMDFARRFGLRVVDLWREREAA